MLTTLATGSITLDTVAQYKFSATDKKLVIRLTSDGNHKLVGDVKITLSNADIIPIKLPDGSQIADYFNSEFKFTAVSATILEFSQVIDSGITIAESFSAIPEGESAIEAEITNDSIDLPAGRYTFFLVNTDDIDFSTSKISAKHLAIGGTTNDGIESLFDKEGAGDFFSIDGQELMFSYPAQISIKDDDSGVTNIPLVINPS